jgi:hypothetical protein
LTEHNCVFLGLKIAQIYKKIDKTQHV